MGKGSPVGVVITFDSYKLTVIGVVKDFVYGDMYGAPDPVVFNCAPDQASYLFVRINQQAHTSDVLARLQAVMKKYNPAYPFEYSFVDDDFNAQFKGESLISKLSQIFAGLAIVISCLGLFGLAAYTAERRTKEIGIRKVLGASVVGLTRLLSKEFLQLVFLSSLIAFPISWWAMSNWLQNYAYHINISWWVFLAAGLSAMIIALATISYQAIKAALMNPVKSLRTE
jgi:ABC-type antimicrobial peptide transport system permease subunit